MLQEETSSRFFLVTESRYNTSENPLFLALICAIKTYMSRQVAPLNTPMPFIFFPNSLMHFIVYFQYHVLMWILNSYMLNWIIFVWFQWKTWNTHRSIIGYGFNTSSAAARSAVKILLHVQVEWRRTLLQCYIFAY